MKCTNIPIRRISFTTPSARRAALVEEAKALYSEFLGAPAGKDAASSFSAAPDSQKILGFVNARIEAKPEESDVVHDLLAYLAERMIEMNKEKNAEIKGFLEWLERELGAHIETLTNRTILKQYHELDFDGFLSILKKNKTKISANLSGKDFQKNLMTEFEKSRSKLAPLTNEIKATDDLIDAIVYRLYGLTEDEIRIVEGSISGEKNVEGTKT